MRQRYRAGTAAAPALRRRDAPPFPARRPEMQGMQIASPVAGDPRVRRLRPFHRKPRSHHMQINLTGHHVDITEALRGYVDSKFERLARHFDHVLNAHVILSVEKLRQKAEATLHVNGGKVFADSVHEDMYAAIDALIDKLDRQVLKHKEKKIRQRANGPKAPETE
jgi:putative sigma-54 modulation protein